MRIKQFQVTIFVFLLLFSGCSTRSISDSGYRESERYYGSNSQYRGELDELSVLGVNSSEDISENDIKSALSKSDKIALRRDDPIIMIQSGARFPDTFMTERMERYFHIIPLSGIPDKPDCYVPEQEKKIRKKPSLNKTLRLAAARSGAGAIIVYWGILESAQENMVTKTVSWVPVVGSVFPDETQQMRIRVKGAVIDVDSGKWMMINAKSFDDKRISALISRAESDQTQVAVLKEKAYADFVDTLIKHFSLE